MKKRILCALLLCALLMALSVPAFAAAPPQVQTVSLGIPCTVTVDVGKHGRVSVGGTTYTGASIRAFKVDPGTKLAFVITPDKGYSVSVLTLTGEDVLDRLLDGELDVAVLRDETLLVRFARDTSPSPTPTPTPTLTPTPTQKPAPTPTPAPTPRRFPFGPKTGDESAVSLWAALAAVSALGCAAAAAIWKKKDKK